MPVRSIIFIENLFFLFIENNYVILNQVLKLVNKPLQMAGILDRWSEKWTVAGKAKLNG